MPIPRRAGRAGRPQPVRLHGPGHARDRRGRGARSRTSTPRGRPWAGRAATRRDPGWPTRRSAGSSTTRVAFTGREVRRGRRYAGVILDPPSYGHGPGPGAWQLERDLPALLDACAEVLEPDGFVLLTAHTEGFDGDRLARDLAARDAPAGGIDGSRRPGARRRPMAATSGWAPSRARRGGHDDAMRSPPRPS